MARYRGEERNFMAKAASSTGKETAPGKKTTASKSRTRASQNAQPTVTVLDVSGTDALAAIVQRLDALEEKVSASFLGLAEELRVLKTTSTAQGGEAESLPDSLFPLVADLLQRNLTEHLAPVTAALKRLEERIGFVANRFKQGGGGGQERQKPWRQEHSRHARTQRGQSNGQRSTQGQQPQQWTPPSAASVQGHFAPRPLPGRGFIEEEE